MLKVTGGQAVVQALIREGVETVFGIPGTYNLQIYDALQDAPAIRHILACHEGGAAMMADGYARASGSPGVCLAIGGPGATNALTGLVTAHAESSPVLLITTEIQKELIGLDRGVSHEIKLQLEIFRAALQAATRASAVQAIPAAIHRMMALMRSGRPRPTCVEIPWDVLGERAEVEMEGRLEVEWPSVDPARLARAAHFLKEAKRPLLFCGAGVHRAGAAAEVCALAETLQAPVITTASGKGAIPEDHPLALGAGVGRNPALTRALARADLVLAIGTSFDAWSMQGWRVAIPGRIVRIDADPGQEGKNYPSDPFIHGDARAVLSQLRALLPARYQGDGTFARELKGEADDARAAALAANESGAQVVSQLREVLPRDALLTVDLTLALQWIAWNLEIYEPGSLLLPWNSATLGFALPAALGAQVAHPDRAVVAIAGDGGFLFTGQELLTAARHKLPVITLLFNNAGHGSIKLQQLTAFQRAAAVEWESPDYVGLARAYGIEGRCVTSLDTLGAHLRDALESRKPTLIEVPVVLDEMMHPWAPL